MLFASTWWKWELDSRLRYSWGMGNLPFDFAVENFPLAETSLYKVGGPAKLALIPRTRAEVEEAFAWLHTQDLPKIVLGGGSNVLCGDDRQSAQVIDHSNRAYARSPRSPILVNLGPLEPGGGIHPWPPLTLARRIDQ